MENFCTTLEQSRNLIKLGLDKMTADMTWVNTHDVDRWNIIPRTCEEIRCSLLEQELDEVEMVSAWSLSALLEVMPNNDYWEICIWQYKDQRWQCVFDDVEFSNGETKSFVADTPIDAAYEMVCYLLRNNLIKKGDNDE